jgi:flavodoxin
MKKIVVYFSYTGHTKIIANMIKKLNFDILGIKIVMFKY